MKELADIGLIGLAVMGENLVLNMESKGFRVAVFNRTVEKVDKFISGRGAGKNFIGTHSVEELVKSLKRPRKVMMLVKAGQAVDDFIEQIIPYLEPGDIISTGTPEGVVLGMANKVWLKPGDTVTVEVDGLGQLTNTMGDSNS